MAQRRHHYELAFEEYLRSRRVPYVAVDEARKALLPPGAVLSARSGVTDAGAIAEPSALKCFDFVVYSDRGNLLLDVKGRKVARRVRASRGGVEDRAAEPLATPRRRGSASAPRSSLESWVTEEDIDSLSRWRTLFGEGFDAAFAFVYWCDDQPPDGLFQEVFEHRGRWYAVRCVRVDPYTRVMKRRSAKWRTVHVPAALFERISQPLLGV